MIPSYKGHELLLASTATPSCHPIRSFEGSEPKEDIMLAKIFIAYVLTIAVFGNGRLYKNIYSRKLKLKAYLLVAMSWQIAESICNNFAGFNKRLNIVFHLPRLSGKPSFHITARLSSSELPSLWFIHHLFILIMCYTVSADTSAVFHQYFPILRSKL